MNFLYNLLNVLIINATIQLFYFTGRADMSTCDHSYDVPMPLIAAVGKLGEVALPIIEILKKHGASISNYYSKN